MFFYLNINAGVILVFYRIIVLPEVYIMVPRQISKYLIEPTTTVLTFSTHL